MAAQNYSGRFPTRTFSLPQLIERRSTLGKRGRWDRRAATILKPRSYFLLSQFNARMPNLSCRVEIAVSSE